MPVLYEMMAVINFLEWKMCVLVYLHVSVRMLTWDNSVREYLVSQFHIELTEGTNASSYCNSILQCLYYSAPFRETVLSYPKRSSPEAISVAAAKATPRAAALNQAANGAKKQAPVNRNSTAAPGQGQKAEDKDSPEYRKKLLLAAGPVLNLSYQNATSYDMPESLFTSLKDIFEAAVTSRFRTGVISPNKLVEVLRKENEMFRSAMHQDAHEFLNLLLNAVVEEIEKHERRVEAQMGTRGNGGNIDSVAESGTISFPPVFTIPKTGTPQSRWLQELFEGTLTSETRCLTCENVSQRDEPFLDLSVDLEQHSSVTSCLRRFSEEEMLCERNKFHCDNCGGLQEAEKRMKIKRLPKILALHLKRFKYTEDLQRLQKLFHRVVYPYHLRLFNTTDDAENPDRLYELYAVVVHIGGGPFHGHYVSIIKTQDRGWLLFDDEIVEPVDRSFVRNFFGDRPGLAAAYVLFYQETTFEAMQQEMSMERRRATAEHAPIGLGLRAKESTELHRIQSASDSPSPLTSPLTFANLDHAVTAPQFQPNGHIQPPNSPPLAPEPVPIVAPASPTLASKKERAKEEKERKAADKERERVEKQKRKENEQLGEIGGGQSNGTKDSGLDRFKRSKSLRFGPLGKKEKDKAAATVTAAPNTAPPGPASGGPVVEDADGPGSSVATEQPPEKEKKSRFSIRKKSFGMLSSGSQ